MPKGKYYGPDKYKGVRPTGKDRYYGPNKYKGLAQSKGKSKLQKEAERLGKSKYAGALTELDMNEDTNLKLYGSASDQRRAAIDREIGSINAAGATTNKQIGDLGTNNATAYQQAMANSQSNTQALMDRVNTNNTNMLSSLQAEMKNRGVENVGEYSNLQGNLGKNNELLAAVGSIQHGSLQTQAGLADQRFKGMQASSSMLQNTAASGARGQAQTDMMDLYNKYLEKQQELDTAQVKTKLEKGDYINQTYLTLKEKAAQRAAEKAQAKLQAAIASGNLAYKNTALQVGTQYKYDKLASDVAQKGIENKLKEKGFSVTKAKAIADMANKSGRLDLDWQKFEWNKANPKKSAAINWNDLLAAGN